MFGEEFMAFITEERVDENGKMTLPEESLAEEGEVLYLGYPEYKEDIQIGSFRAIIKKINELKTKLNQTDDELKRIEISKYLEKLKKLFITKLYVDNNRQVIIPNEIREIFGLDKEYLILKGNDDVINIYTTEEQVKGLYRK